jgi:sugar phosphate isomerase/epimerase
MPDKNMPRLGAAITFDMLDTLGDWIFKHDRNIEIQDFADPEILTGDTAPLIEKYCDALGGYMGDIGIHGPFFGFDIASRDAEIRGIVKQRLLQGLEVAESLNATHMVVHSPFTKWHTQNFLNYPQMRAQMFDDAIVSLTQAVKRAAEIGCTMVLENIQDIVPADRRELAEAINSPYFKLSVDTGHANLEHGSNGAPPVDYFIKDAGEMLGHVHLQDTDGYADRHWIPGEGTVNWTSVFDAIALLETKPRLIIEVRRNLHRLPAAVKALKERGLAC